MTIVKVHQAKSQLSKLLKLAEAGEEVIIANAGKPMARLIPYDASAGRRVPGIWADQIKMAEDFDVMSDWDLAEFYGREP